ncbi:MAG: hypothetical protein IH624_01625 [Phycisphaerae bacterium]|nr:hypothetical protein [Phycisphaerae bacterium]
MEWTERAKDAWKRYCEEASAKLVGTEIDAAKVIADVQRRIEAEMSGAEVITENDVRRITSQSGLSALGAGIRQREIDKEKKTPVALMVVTLLLGVLLPVGAAAVELATRICASVFFDPLPTGWYVLLFMMIPAANLACLAVLWNSAEKYAGKAGYINGAGLGAAIIYTIMFLPLLPISAFATVVYGLGLCGLAPLLALVVTLLVRSRLRRLHLGEQAGRLPGLWGGLAVSVVLLAVAVLPGMFTHLGVQMALSESPAARARGVKMLRAVGNEKRLVEMCYREGWGVGSNMFYSLMFDGSIPVRDLRGVYYRVTGKAFNTAAPPKSGFRAQGLFEEWDFEQGGEAVGGQLRHLSLVSSRMDGSVDADAALGYMEWTMIFKNAGNVQQEARAQIQLPAGAVVSRLTLWINGEEREAAFGSRGKTRAAYESVVRRQRDPVLITTAGPDRIMMQCFPVPPRGGEMKVRVGITAPLHLVKGDEAVFALPYFNDRNFRIGEEVRHSVWMESKRPILRWTGMEIAAGADENRTEGVIRGSVAQDALKPGAGIVVERDAAKAWAWTADTMAGGDGLVIQHVEAIVRKGPQHVVVVMDTSAGMAGAKEQIQRALASAELEGRVTVIAADDEVEVLSDGIAGIHNVRIGGGKDNVPALERAWDIASEADGGVVLWIHGAQPHVFAPLEGLLQRWERRPAGPRLIDVQVAAGPNNVVEGLDGVWQAASLGRTGEVGADLALLFGRWRGDVPTFEAERRRAGAEEKPSDNAKETSSHLVRLWARDAVEQMRLEGGKENLDEALRVALRYQLVTPVSGAVVLETAAQYKAAGLEPVDPETVPTIPEPEVWALLIIVGVVLGWVVLRDRRRVRVA